jgi:hypothetical protein
MILDSDLVSGSETGSVTSVADPGSGVFLSSGSGIRCLFDPWIRDPGWVKNPDPGSGPNNPNHISESLETICLVKILQFFDADPVSGMKNIWISYPGSRINIRGCALIAGE